MLRALILLLILSISLYWYAGVGVLCMAPLSYRVVALDERFDLTPDEVAAVITEAETLWEQAIGRDLFYATDGTPDIAVSFIFDDRQERAIAEESLRGSLDAKEATTENLDAAYTKMVAEYHAKAKAHEATVGAYEEELAAYNATVAAYNATGGAPEAEYAKLQAEERRLATRATAITKAGEELATLAVTVNRIGEEGNEIIRQYNAGVNQYNNRFGEIDEFTQGDYEDGRIHIYTFTSRTELVTVMAHELGHALDIDHVEGNQSIMYYLMGDQPTPPALSESDVTAMTAICGESDSLTTKIRTFINRYLL
jgi:hypothetical protein